METTLLHRKGSDGQRMNSKAMEILGTTTTKLVLMKTLGISPVELDNAVEAVELQSIEHEREINDKQTVKVTTRNAKCWSTLGVDPSFYVLQKQLGVSGEELERALEQVKENQELAEEEAYAKLLEESEKITAAEKNVIIKSEKLQKLLGIDPQHARLMRILGASEEEIRETLEFYNNPRVQPQDVE